VIKFPNLALQTVLLPRDLENDKIRQMPTNNPQASRYVCRWIGFYILWAILLTIIFCVVLYDPDSPAYVKDKKQRNWQLLWCLLSSLVGIPLLLFLVMTVAQHICCRSQLNDCQPMAPEHHHPTLGFSNYATNEAYELVRTSYQDIAKRM
jgi:hypothetical protein